MADGTGIEWTEATWNPVAGCAIVSPGCTNCYAMPIAHRLGHNPKTTEHYGGLTRRSGGRTVWTGRARPVPQTLDLPRGWRKPRRIFVNSMSDLFHDDIPPDYIRRVFGVMVDLPRHTFQVLTKRPGRLVELAPDLPWPANVWMGVSVESAGHLGRVDPLRRVPAAVRFISAEPLLGPLDGIDLTGIGWLIVGGESGSTRVMDPAWARALRDRCAAAGVAFFLKQMGGRRKSAMPPIPSDLMIRQFPGGADSDRAAALVGGGDTGMAAVTITTDFSPSLVLDAIPRERWAEAIEAKAQAARQAARRGLESDILFIARVVCDVYENRAWEIAGRSSLREWIERDMWFEPLALCEWLESTDHLTYTGDRLPIAQVVDAIAGPVVRAKAGRPPAGEGNPDNRKDYGNSAAYTLARLRRDHPELAERVVRGELSTNAAAVEAGFRRRPTKLERAKAAVRGLDEGDRAALLAWLATEYSSP